MTGLEVLIKGVVFGLGAAAPIGPVNVEMARRALLHGYRHGVCLGLGAVSVDVVYACAAVAGVSVAGSSPWVFWPLAVGGTGLLVYLGISCLLAARSAMRSGWNLRASDGESPLWKTYLTGVAMTAINPITLVFWFGGLTGQALAQGIATESLPMLAAGVFVGTTAWVVCFAGLMSVLGRYRKPWWMAAADAAGGLVLLAFAALSVFGLLRKLGLSPL
jgi:threonine/homoserine/homoserine lactone efflux protein